MAGDHYLVAFIAVYSKDKPVPFMDFSLQQSTWIEHEDFLKQGAILAWYVDNGTQNQLPGYIKKRYPQAEFVGVYAFDKLVSIATAPVYVGVALLGPGGQHIEVYIPRQE